MKLFRIIILIYFIIQTLSSCQKKDDISGHWVSKEYFQGKPFKTIDLFSVKENDSLVYYIDVNRDNLSGFKGGSNLVTGYGPHQYEFLMREYDFFKIEFKDDSLLLLPSGGNKVDYLDSALNGSFVKISDTRITPNELFYGCYIQPILCRDSTRNRINLGTARLLIGFTANRLDSVHIISEGSDVYLGLRDIPRFIRDMQFLIPESAILELHLYSDKRISESLLKDIVKIVRDIDYRIKIYRTSFDYDKKRLCYNLL